MVLRGGGDQTGAAAPIGGQAGLSAMDLLALMMLYAASPAAVAAASHAFHHQPDPKTITQPAPAQRGDPWKPYIVEAARRFNLPQDWIRSVMQAESSGRTMVRGRPITSPAGAMGLMQLMPDTYAKLRAEHRLGPDPHNPRDNILAGAAYLREMYDRFGWPGMFAAYNAGPKRFEAHLREAQPLPAETRRYLVTLGVDVEDAVSVAQVQLRKAAQPAEASAEAPVPLLRSEIVIMGEAGPEFDEEHPAEARPDPANENIRPARPPPPAAKPVGPRPVPDRSIQLVQNDMRGSMRALDGP